MMEGVLSPVTPWRTLSGAPHRLFFFTGMWQLVAVSIWWAFVLGMRAAGVTGFEPALPGVFMHGGVVLFLLFTPFMAGFLFTVFPRWQPAPPVSRALQLFVFAGMNAGQVLVLAGMYVHATLVATGLAVLLLAWMALSVSLFVSYCRASARVTHALTVQAGLLGGFIGLLMLLHAVLFNDWSHWPLIRALGIWAFLLPVYFSVCHRMVPFFSSRVVPDYRVYKPTVLLFAGVTLSVARAALETFPEVRWLASGLLALVLAWLSWKWWPRARHGHALLGVLHLSLLWLAGGVALHATQDILLALDLADPLGRAPLHALGIGFFGGMLLSMVTRVSLGHSGRPLVLDRFTWLIFCLVQAAVLARIAGEFLNGYTQWMALAGLIWLAAFVAWAWRFMRIYWQPRIDGAPG